MVAEPNSKAAGQKALPRNRPAAANREQPDSALHHRLRMGIVSALAGVSSKSFNELKLLLDTSDGNLSVHARKLEDAGYIVCEKSFEARRPRSDYRLTPVGRRALQRYLNHMEALIRATRATLAGPP